MHTDAHAHWSLWCCASRAWPVACVVCCSAQVSSGPVSRLQQLPHRESCRYVNSRNEAHAQNAHARTRPSPASTTFSLPDGSDVSFAVGHRSSFDCGWSNERKPHLFCHPSVFRRRGASYRTATLHLVDCRLRDSQQQSGRCAAIDKQLAVRHCGVTVATNVQLRAMVRFATLVCGLEMLCIDNLKLDATPACRLCDLQAIRRCCLQAMPWARSSHQFQLHGHLTRDEGLHNPLCRRL